MNRAVCATQKTIGRLQNEGEARQAAADWYRYVDPRCRCEEPPTLFHGAQPANADNPQGPITTLLIDRCFAAANVYARREAGV